MTFFFYFLVMMFTLCRWFYKKLELCLMAISVLLKTKSGQAQISMPKIFTLMSKTRPFYFYFYQKKEKKKNCFKKLYFSVVSILCKITLSLLDIVIFPRRYFPHLTSTIKWYLNWSWQETILKIQTVVYQTC